MTGWRAAEPQAVQRLRLSALCLALVTLVFAQSAGQVAPDTKLDLAADPLRFLGRSLTMWDQTGGSGQLQNQAYGYLFPIGPFFALGKLIALPAWVIQRSWQSALVVVAFLGVVRLARLLGTTAFWPKVGAGLVYALAPRILSEIGSISSELMPVAALPWVLIPLVQGSRQGSPRRQASRAGLALLLAGGVNAAATLAILPVPILWLLTRQRGPRRRALAKWFAVAVFLSCAWWAIPLLLLGKYSPPFLDWIEPSQITTSVTSLSASLRGADHWEAYLGANVWPAGWILVTVPLVVAATVLVAGAGLCGLARADHPDPLFLRLCLLAGLALVGMGFVATVGPPAGSGIRVLLDGPLNAFRNVHKFDPLIRLPIALGAGHLASRALPPITIRVRQLLIYPRLLAAAAVAVIATLAIAPVITNNLVGQGRTTVDAAWWTQTGKWLGQHEGSGRALVVPGSPRPVYTWGATVDDALQPVADGPWAVRDGIPLGSAAYIRMLDSVSLSLAAGREDDELPALLARAGMRYLVVRNDLDTVASGTTNLAFVHATIANTPGLPLVASFGPADRFAPPTGQLVDLGATVPRPAVQVYEVAATQGPVSLLPALALTTANGSADQLGSMLADGVAASAPVTFGSPRNASVVTDGIARREVTFGQTGVPYATMTADQPFGQRRAAHDYLPAGTGPTSSWAYTGDLAGLSASSSGADAGALVNPGVDNGPWSALDGDPRTAWRSGSLSGAVGQWFSVDLRAAHSLPGLTLAFAPGLDYPDRLRVSTDAGSLDVDVTPDPLAQQVPLPSGPTRRITLTVLATSGGNRSVGISSLVLPGITVGRTLDVPVGRTLPDLLSFAVQPGGRAGCLTVAGRAACDPAFVAAGESDGVIDRSFSLPGQAAYDIAASAVPQPGPALDALLDAGQSVRASASSVDNADPRERPGAAVDGDPATSWVAQVGDQQPSLTVGLPGPRTMHSLDLSLDRATPAARPTRVRLAIGTARWDLAVPASGRIVLPRPVTASAVKVTVLSAELRVETSTVNGGRRPLPAGISEIAIDGRAVPAPNGPIRFSCGTGPSAFVLGKAVPLQGSASRADVLAGRPITLTPCDRTPATLGAGEVRVGLSANAVLAPRTLSLYRVGAAVGSASSPGSADVRAWSSTRRQVTVSTSAAAILEVHENANAGWQASLDGHRLRPITLDGWQQGWLVPAGARGVITLKYGPQRLFEAGLLVGMLAVIALLLLAIRGDRGDHAEVAAGLLERRPTAWGYPVLAATGAFVLAGVAGLAMAVLIANLSRLTLPRWIAPHWLPALPVGVLVLVGGADQFRAGFWSSQLLCVAAIVLAVIGSARLRQDGLDRARSSGRSKQNHETVPSAVEVAAVSRKNFQ